MYEQVVVDKAIALREQGVSILKIAKECNVSKATVFGWTKDVVLTEKQQKVLKQNSHASVASQAFAKKCLLLREAQQQEGFEFAQNCEDLDYAMGCMLFWAEGDKAKNRVCFTNTDINMCVMFVKFLKKYFQLPNEKFQLSFQYHDDAKKSVKDIYGFWIEKLELEGCVHHKPYKKKRKSVKTKHENGIVRITVNSTEIANKLWGSVQCFGNFSDKNALR